MATKPKFVIEDDAPPPIDPALLSAVDEALEAHDKDHAMDAAPRDGRWCEVTENGTDWVPARYYRTRVRVGLSVSWVPVSCWSTSEPKKYASRVGKPIAWRWPPEASDASVDDGRGREASHAPPAIPRL